MSACWKALAVTLLVAAGACGKKGPPLPPLRPVPGPVTAITARRLAGEVFVQFTLPTQNQDGTRPVDLAAVEVYALTVAPPPPGSLPLTADEVVRRGRPVATITVRAPDAGTAETGTSDPGGRATTGQPAPGDHVTVVEALTPDAWRLGDATARRGGRAAGAPPAGAPRVAPPLWWPPPSGLPRRVYVAVGLSGRGRRGPPSALAVVPLGPLPPAPPAASACYTETAVTVEWAAPPTARRALQQPAVPPVLPTRAIVSGPPPTRYNVYEVAAPVSEPRSPARLPRPLNPTPLDGPPFVDPRVEFGAERCYVVRAVETTEGVDVEGPPSPPACTVMLDVFPPPPPRGLSAVAGEGAIYLVWEPSTGSDLAGYLVLRGDAPDEKLRALIPVPVRETTYRDTAVEPGRRYVYAVVAVDRAGNVSPQSNRVEEIAR